MGLVVFRCETGSCSKVPELLDVLKRAGSESANGVMTVGDLVGGHMTFHKDNCPLV
jgi:hypothetical protein